MSRLVMKLALALLPPSRRGWGEAMMGEFAHLSDGQSGFALGCLGVSLRENVMTWEGWARLGFGAVLVMSGWLTLFWTSSVIHLLKTPENLSDARLVQALTLEGFGLFPLVLCLAALRAMKAPMDRFHLARTGHNTTFACLLLAGILQLFLCAGSVYLFLTIDPKAHRVILNTLEFGIFGSMAFLSVAWFARKSAEAMRKTGLIAVAVLLGFAVLVSAQNWLHPGIIVAGVLPTTLFIAFLMFLTATAGALFMWMERPAQSFGQN
jgi:hypothetical protein